MSVLNLVRPDLQHFSGYLSARKENSGGAIWLNANESAYPQEFDAQQLNRYPEPQPSLLKQSLCEYYQTSADRLLITRGSDEAIDLLLRALCVPGKDNIVVQTPTFGMYSVCARLHACTVFDSPLVKNENYFDWNIDELINTILTRQSKIVFICSPANPTGQCLPRSALLKLLEALKGQCVVVIDEAYGEYSQQPSAIELIEQFPHLAVLRTLSKAHALAGARIGCVLADAQLITVLKACQAPYPISKPSAELALKAFSDHAITRTQQLIRETITQRQYLIDKLSEYACVQRIFTTDANFILVQFDNTALIYQTLLNEGILVRSMTQYPSLENCLRISIGTQDENKALLRILEAI